MSEETGSVSVARGGRLLRNLNQEQLKKQLQALQPKTDDSRKIDVYKRQVLNRVYTEWYRNRGYDFTITSSTAFDQKWIYGRNIYQNISNIVDEVLDCLLYTSLRGNLSGYQKVCGKGIKYIV